MVAELGHDVPAGQLQQEALPAELNDPGLQAQGSILPVVHA